MPHQAELQHHHEIFEYARLIAFVCGGDIDFPCHNQLINLNK